MSTLELYMFLMLPEIGAAIGFLAFCLFIITGVAFAPKLEGEAVFPYWKKTCFWAIFLGTIAVLIPGRETMLVLLGWNMGSAIEGLDQLPKEIVEFIRAYLSNQMGELLPEATKEVVKEAVNP